MPNIPFNQTQAAQASSNDYIRKVKVGKKIELPG